jgi:hypothetical protein
LERESKDLRGQSGEAFRLDAVAALSAMSRLPKISHPKRKPYFSDLSDVEWEILQPLVPESRGFGHPVEVDFSN